MWAAFPGTESARHARTVSHPIHRPLAYCGECNTHSVNEEKTKIEHGRKMGVMVGKASQKGGRERALWISGKENSRKQEQQVQRPWGRNMPRVFGEQYGSRCGANSGQVAGDVAREERGGQTMRSLTDHNITLAFILSEMRSHVRGFRRSHMI